jgi:hypothetical protein
MNSKQWMIAAIGLAGALAAGAASARSNDEVQWSVTIGSPVGTPVYTQPAPVYGAPVYGAPVYGAPVYGTPVYGAPVYTAPGYGQRHYQRPTRWDRDGDGIPNRRDRVYNPRWDRDGDGIPNRHDRYNGYDDHRRGWGR